MSKISILSGMILLMMWLAGIALTKTTVSMVVSIIIPMYSWYLVVEKSLQQIGWI